MSAYTSESSKEGYTFSSTLAEFMNQMLQYYQIAETSQTEKNAGRDDSSNVDEKINKRNLDRKKRYVLDKFIFQSMANMIFFFEYLKKYPDLREVFEDDIKELFGFIRVGPDKYQGRIL